MATLVAQIFIEIGDNAIFAGLPYAGLPIAVSLGIDMRTPVIYPRKEVKEHGTKKIIEGRFKKGDKVIVIDDLITDGGTKMELIAPMRDAGLIAEYVAVLLDREQGARKTLDENSLKLRAVFTLREVLAALFNLKHLTHEQYQTVMEYLNG